MEVVLRKKGFKIERKDVEKVLEGVRVESNSQTHYYVVVNGRELPVKKALWKVLKEKGVGLTLLDFTTQDAVRIFKRLGFDVVKRGKWNLLRFAGAIKGGGNAVEDKKRLYEGSP